MHEDLELADIGSAAADEPPHQPLRAFASDVPNAKLARNMRAPPRAPGRAPLRNAPSSPLPTGSQSLNGSRLSSPAAQGSSLPVGSALQVVRASSAGRFPT